MRAGVIKMEANLFWELHTLTEQNRHLPCSTPPDKQTYDLHTHRLIQQIMTSSPYDIYVQLQRLERVQQRALERQTTQEERVQERVRKRGLNP